MAQRIEELPRERAYAIYPWSEWMDGGCWQAFRGQDFAGTPRQFANTLHSRARRYGRRVQTRVEGESVKFRFSKRT